MFAYSSVVFLIFFRFFVLVCFFSMCIMRLHNFRLPLNTRRVLCVLRLLLIIINGICLLLLLLFVFFFLVVGVVVVVVVVVGLVL